MNENKTSSKTIAVTGASGYIAMWIVKKLLEAGHTVHGTVRSLINQGKVAPLKKLSAKGKLTLFEADLLNENSFDECFKGCDIVMHTASPFFMGGHKDPQKELIDPALKGTENVLQSASKYPSIKKVILTSSIAAMCDSNYEVKKKGGLLSEKMWNEMSTINDNPYPLSKVMAEKRAWEIAKAQNQWKLIVINPGGVAGPSLTDATISGSVDIMKQICKGNFAAGVPKISFGWVDVRDVAEAHIAAAFSDKAEGRYILADEVLSFLDIANIIKTKYADKIKLPSKNVPKFLVWLMAPKIGITRTYVSRSVGIPIKIDNSKSKTLGIKYGNIKNAILEHVEQIMQNTIA